MRVLATPRNARGLDLAALEEIASTDHALVGQLERDRLRDGLLSADPGLLLLHEDERSVHLRARGRSGLSIELGTVWHEIRLPDWHEGSTITWLADRFVNLLRVFPRTSGGTILDAEDGRVLDPMAQAGLVDRYRTAARPGPGAHSLPVLDVMASDADRFAELAEPVLRRRGASAADRAWFFFETARQVLNPETNEASMAVRYHAKTRCVRVERIQADGSASVVPARLRDGVDEDPPPMPDNLTDRDMDDVAIAYLASLIAWT